MRPLALAFSTKLEAAKEEIKLLSGVETSYVSSILWGPSSLTPPMCKTLLGTKCAKATSQELVLYQDWEGH